MSINFYRRTQNETWVIVKGHLLLLSFPLALPQSTFLNGLVKIVGVGSEEPFPADEVLGEKK